MGIRHAGGKAAGAQDGQIDQVVTHVAALREIKFLARQQFRHGRAFVFDALADQFDAEVGGTARDDGRIAPGDDGDPDARLRQQLDAQSVTAEKGLAEIAFGSEIQATVGHDPVDIEAHQTNSGSLFDSGHHASAGPPQGGMRPPVGGSEPGLRAWGAINNASAGPPQGGMRPPVTASGDFMGGSEPDCWQLRRAWGGNFHTTCARKRSCMLRAPSSCPLSSVTSNWFSLRRSIISTASTAKRSGGMVRGWWLMISPTGT